MAADDLTTTAPAALTGAEWNALAELEERIEAGIKQMDKAWAALAEVHDRQLYRHSHSNFGDYLADRWKFSRPRAYQLMAAVKDKGKLSTAVDSAILDNMGERQMRALRAAPEDERADVLNEAARRAGGAPSGPAIEAVIAERTVPAAPAEEPTGAVVVRRDDPEMIRRLLSPKAVADAHKANRAEKEADRREERIARIETIARGNKPLHFDTAFSVIMADPPWRYDATPTNNLAIENHYPTMDLDAICAMGEDVMAVATPDAVLYLWYPPGMATAAARVAAAWGFVERSGMVWVKDYIGPGYWARMRHEPVMIAVRGNPPTPAADVRRDSVIEHPRGAHSAKPPQLAEYIEAAYPTLPKLEMFCRSPRDGWTAWGNQAEEEVA